MGDVKLPSLAHSASAGAVLQNSGDAPPKKLGKLPDLVTIKFQPGKIGLGVEGTLVTRSASCAWMKGVRAGWSIKAVAGQKVEETDGAEDLLLKAADGDERYEIHFQKGQSKFGIGSEEVSKEELQRQENRKLLRRTFHFLGHIDHVEHRGITLKQLERVQHFAEEWCHVWKDTAPPKVSKTSGRQLSMNFLNWHHLNCWMTLPATERKKCSFVELVASGRQVPTWFVIHWWGEPFMEFMECLKAHVKARRSATEESPYWICAYASRQHTNEGEIYEDPKTSSYYKAIQASKFHVLLVVDQQATAFSRIWCALEETAVLDRPHTDMDIAAFTNSKAHILTQGLTEDEQELDLARPGQGLRAKAVREVDFPLELVEAALTAELHKGEATNEEDRLRILNVVAGTDLERDPPAEHRSYVETSRRLQSLFASLLLLRGTYSRKERSATLCERISSALQGDLWRKAIDLNLEGLTTKGMELLAQSIPPNLQDLKLRLRNSTITNEDLHALAEMLPKQLKTVSLDLTNCKEINEKGKNIFAATVEALFAEADAKVAVDLSLANTEALQYIMECEQPKKDMVLALGVSFCLSEEEFGKHASRAVPAVPSLLKALATEPKGHVRVATVRALASFGERAREAVPELERLLIEDTEAAVQKACAVALNKISGKELKLP
jgi:hypothetical protein